jgi:hypothetical protein
VLEGRLLPPVESIHSAIVNSMFSTSCPRDQEEDGEHDWLRGDILGHVINNGNGLAVIEACGDRVDADSVFYERLIDRVVDGLFIVFDNAIDNTDLDMAMRIVLNLTHVGVTSLLQPRFISFLVSGIERGNDIALSCIGVLINMVDADPIGTIRVLGGI